MFNIKSSHLLITSSLIVSTLSAASALTHPEVVRSVKTGEQLYELVFNPVDNLVYVASYGPFSMSKEEQNKIRNHQIIGLDGKTLEKKRVIKTGELATFGIGLNKETQKLYVGDTQAGKIGVYDLKSGQRVGIISAPENGNKHLREIVTDEVNNKIYATVVGGFGENDKPSIKSALWIIDGKTDKLEKVLVSPVKSATGLAVNPQTKRIYVSDMDKNQVAEIDANSYQVLRTFSTGATGKDPYDVEPSNSAQPNQSDTINIDLDNATGRLFAANQKSGTVTVVNIADGKLIKTIKTGNGALSVKWNTKTDELYVANRTDGTVSVIDGKTYFITAHLPSGSHPQTLSIDQKTGNVYVSNKPKGKDFNDKNAPEPYEPGGDTVTLIKPWTDPTTIDELCPHDEICSKVSGRTPPR